MTKALFALALLAACDTNSDPAKLDHAQIIAVRAEPAHVAPGGRARIDVLAGDDAGNVFETTPDAIAGELAVEHTADGWFVTAGPAPQIATLAITLAIDGVTWPATKALVVSEEAANPHVATMQVDGADSTELVAAIGAKATLTAVGTGGELTYAWYSSIGELTHYRFPEATLETKEAGEGNIVVVVRDGVGGVDWQLLPARVE